MFSAPLRICSKCRIQGRDSREGKIPTYLCNFWHNQKTIVRPSKNNFLPSSEDIFLLRVSIANLFSIRVPSRLFFLHSFPNWPADIICFVILLRTCVGYVRLYFCTISRITCLLLLCLHRSLGYIRFLGKTPI